MTLRTRKAPVAVAVVSVVMASFAWVGAQQGGAKPVPPALYVPVAQVEATLKVAIAENRGDIAMRTIDAGEHNVVVAAVYTAKPMPGANLHEKVTEMYHMIEGAGTHVSGGTLVNPQRMPEASPPAPGGAGPTVRGDSIRGGVSRRVVKGDVIVIPAGTPHQWIEITEPVKYLDIRIDPGKLVTLLSETDKRK